MAQFSVNASRFDPYKNFKFRVKWDGRYVAGISKVGGLKRTTKVVEHREGGDPSTTRKSPGRTDVRRALARARRHARSGIRAVGEQDLALRRRLGRGDVAQGFPKGHHHRAVQRSGTARDRLQRLSVLGLRVSGVARSRRRRKTRSPSSTSSWRTRAGSATNRSWSLRSPSFTVPA